MAHRPLPSQVRKSHNSVTPGYYLIIFISRLVMACEQSVISTSVFFWGSIFKLLFKTLDLCFDYNNWGLGYTLRYYYHGYRIINDFTFFRCMEESSKVEEDGGRKLAEANFNIGVALEKRGSLWLENTRVKNHFDYFRRLNCYQRVLNIKFGPRRHVCGTSWHWADNS